jgi:hypothetical protein
MARGLADAVISDRHSYRPPWRPSSWGSGVRVRRGLGREQRVHEHVLPLPSDLLPASQQSLFSEARNAEFLFSRKKAHCILVTKKNRPGLYAQLKNLPWRQIPAGTWQRDRATAATSTAR